VWGEVAMPAHPKLTDQQASAMVAYIMSLADPKPSVPSLPDRGTYVPPAGSGDAPKGVIALPGIRRRAERLRYISIRRPVRCSVRRS
jgi:hypothetical protein